MAKVHIGTSGYSYQHWGKGVFYPPEIRPSGWLEHYADSFQTVELNVTFYRLPSEAAFRSWPKRVPPGFLFAVKGSRFITHRKRLRDCGEPLRIFAKRVRLLGGKLGPILWQFPPRMKPDTERLGEFLRLLRKTGPLRHTFEFRDQRWFTPEVRKMLSLPRFSLCLADWPFPRNKIVPGSDFVYVRRHGVTSLYASLYTEKELRQDARRIRRWAKEGKDVYVYFNNDAHGNAVRNALRLKALAEQSSRRPG